MTDFPPETSCPDRETLTAFIDGALDDDELPPISSHLVACERCYDTVASAVRYLSGQAQSEDVQPPRALLPALITAIGIAVALTLILLVLLADC